MVMLSFELSRFVASLLLLLLLVVIGISLAVKTSPPFVALLELKLNLLHVYFLLV